jgi:NAD(P)-dependent dehydrogenase (short-subunit alcohol dehydrogenase family)
MGQLDGRVAIITGAASGMGREASLLFAREGAHVILAVVDGGATAGSIARAPRPGDERTRPQRVFAGPSFEAWRTRRSGGRQASEA